MEKYLAGKTNPNNASQWLPLWMHLRDTAEIMERLVREWLPDSAKRSSGMDEESLAFLARFLGYVHDIGKATVLFQTKITKTISEARLRIERYTVLDYREANKKKTPHAAASEAILLNLKCPAGIASIAGAHHTVPRMRGGDPIRNQWGMRNGTDVPLFKSLIIADYDGCPPDMDCEEDFVMYSPYSVEKIVAIKGEIFSELGILDFFSSRARFAPDKLKEVL